MPDELKATIRRQMTEAMKARQSERLSVLRMMLSEISSAQALDPTADELACVRGYHKKLTKARPDYVKVGAAERLAALDREIAVVEEFLPAALPDDELEHIVEQMVRDRAFTQRDFGRAMKEILSQYGDRAEGARVAAILKAKLAGQG